MNKQEEIAWKEYRAKYLSASDEPKENYPMYMLIFLAGYRAAKQSFSSDGLTPRQKEEVEQMIEAAIIKASS